MLNSILKVILPFGIIASIGLAIMKEEPMRLFLTALMIIVAIRVYSADDPSQADSSND